jgi:hypothetical protein
LARREENLLFETISISVPLDQIGLLEVVIISDEKDSPGINPVVEENIEVDGFCLRVELHDVPHSQPIRELKVRSGSENAHVEQLFIVVGRIDEAATLEAEVRV